LSAEEVSWEDLALRVEEKVRRRIYSSLPRGGVRDFSVTVYVDRDDDGRIVVDVDAEFNAHPGVDVDLEGLISEAVEEALKEADLILMRRRLRPE